MSQSRFQRLVCISPLLIIGACGHLDSSKRGDEKTSTLANSRLPASQRVGTLGGGWDTNKEEWRGDCATGTIGYEGAQEASIKFDRAMSEKETASALGFSLDARARYGVYEGDLAADFARDSSSSAFSESATYSAMYMFKNAKLRNGTLSPVGKTASERGPEDFAKTCGHEYVDQLQLGARLLVNIKMNFSSKAEKQNFSANIGLRGPAFSVRAKIKQASESMSRSASVSVRLFQQGGNISRLTTALSGLNVPLDIDDKDKTASALLVCSMDRLDACLNVIDGAVKYATDTNVTDSFPNQINFSTLDLASPNGPAILGYITAPWTDMAVYPPDPFTAADVKVARKELFEAFEKQLGYANRIDDVLGGPIRLSPDQNLAFDTKKKVIEGNITAIVEAGKSCYVAISECSKNKRDILSNNNPNFLDEEFDVLPKTFAQWCDVSNLPVYRLSMKKTVTELLAVAKLDLNDLGSDPCGAAGKSLADLKKVDLSAKGLTSIQPLAALPKIEWLSLKGNEVDDVSPLAAMTTLSYLDVSYNKFFDVKPIAALTGLRTLRAHGNAIDDSKPVRDLFKPMQQLFLNDSEVCAYARQQALDNSLITAQEFKYYGGLNWAPEYGKAGDLSSGISTWGDCGLAVSQLL